MNVKFTGINGQNIFAIILYFDHFCISQFIENKDSNSIFIIFYLNLTIWFSCLKTWVDVSWLGAYAYRGSKKGNFSVT